MIVNPKTGDILDLSPLKRTPSGPATRRVDQRHGRRSKIVEAYVAVSGFAVASSVFWFSLIG